MSEPTDKQIERVARAIARAYVTGFRGAVEQHRGPMVWTTTLDQAVDLQWDMVTQEALEALQPR